MANDEVPPAMTAEEWEERCKYGDGRGVEIAGGGDLSAWDECEGVGIPNSYRHAIAALALHGQPGGFTPGDVAMLRTLEGMLLSGDWGDQDNEAHHVSALAAKIAALLPPEAPR